MTRMCIMIQRRHLRWLTLLFMLTLTMGSAPAVRAHAELLTATPAPGETMAESPLRLELTFNEPLGEGSTFTLFDTTFTQIPIPVAHPAEAQDRLVAAEVPPLAPGTYTVQWLAVSVDGHPITGSYQFTVGGTMLESVAESVALAEGTSFNPPNAVAWIMIILALALPIAAYYWQKGQRP